MPWKTRKEGFNSAKRVWRCPECLEEFERKPRNCICGAVFHGRGKQKLLYFPSRAESNQFLSLYAKQAMEEIDQYTGFLRAEGNLEDALVVLEELSATHADNPVILERLAQLYQHMGETKEAVRQWDRVGEMYLESGDDTGAIRVLNAIIALNPPDVDEYRRLYQELTENQ